MSNICGVLGDGACFLLLDMRQEILLETIVHIQAHMVEVAHDSLERVVCIMTRETTTVS